MGGGGRKEERLWNLKAGTPIPTNIYAYMVYIEVFDSTWSILLPLFLKTKKRFQWALFFKI